MICNASNMEDLKRFVDKRPYFLYCHESQLKIETVHERVLKYNSIHQLEIQNQIDGIFLMDRGTIINYGNGNGNLRLRKTIDGGLLSGFACTPKDDNDKIILSFMRWLNCVILQFETRISVLRHYLW